MKNPFTDHPASVGETYFQHLCAASRFSFYLLMAGVSCLIHAFLPFLFKETASNYVAKLVSKLCNGNRGSAFKEKLTPSELSSELGL
jgi:hypothetical protein